MNSSINSYNDKNDEILKKDNSYKNNSDTLLVRFRELVLEEKKTTDSKNIEIYKKALKKGY